MLLDQLIDLYSTIIIVAVVASWINVPRDHPAVVLLRRVTEPVLEPVRKVLPDTGGIDLSPIVVLIGLRVLRGIF